MTRVFGKNPNLEIGSFLIRLLGIRVRIVLSKVTIKHSFTCRVKFDMIPAMKVFEDLVGYESNQICDFVSVGFTYPSMTNRAYTLIEDKLVVRRNENFIYNRKDGSSESICTKNTKTCTCYSFLDKGMCYHLVAACILDKISIPGLKTKVCYFCYITVVVLIGAID